MPSLFSRASIHPTPIIRSHRAREVLPSSKGLTLPAGPSGTLDSHAQPEMSDRTAVARVLPSAAVGAVALPIDAENVADRGLTAACCNECTEAAMGRSGGGAV